MSSEGYTNDSYGIVGSLKDGRQIAYARESFVIVRGLLNYHAQITIPNLSIIDCILDINIKSTSPPATVTGICEKKITMTADNPIVGFTVQIPVGVTHAGTTITPEVVVIGW